MAIDQGDQTVVTTTEPTAAGQPTVQTDSRRITRTGPGGAETSRRIVVFKGVPCHETALRYNPWMPPTPAHDR